MHHHRYPSIVLPVLALFTLSSVAVEAAAPSCRSQLGRSSLSIPSNAVVFGFRGGASSKKGKKKKTTTSNSASPTKTTKKKKKKSAARKDAQAADAVNQLLKEKDAAQALGDAIRDRADQLRHDAPVDPFTAHIQESLQSVGWAMGATDTSMRTAALSFDDGGAGGVEAAPASVVAHYFLKSHGGAHALQCVCSLLAATAGLGAILLNGVLQLTLLKRCLLFAMIKHVSGLVAASCIAASGIPVSGFRQAVRWMQELSADPVSQYVFYAATVLLWLPATKTGTSSAKATAASPVCWWQVYRLVPVILAGPVVLRELISTALVVSDVLVLTACSSSNASGIKRLLRVTQAFVNAFMSLLVTPSVWRSATAAQRQAVVAKLTSKLSLAMELAVGALMALDAVIRLIGFVFTSSSAAGVNTLGQVIKSLVCTRLYLQFLWTRRRKITKLAATVRGGASAVPMYVLTVLMDPQASMGFTPTDETKSDSTGNGTNAYEWTWRDYVRLALGLDD